MAMVGHKTESIYRRYAIVDAGVLREAAAKIDQAECEILLRIVVTGAGIEPAARALKVQFADQKQAGIRRSRPVFL